MLDNDLAPFILTPLLIFEDFDRTAALAYLVEAGLTESDKGPSGYGKNANHCK